jgi:hypothetical protein
MRALPAFRHKPTGNSARTLVTGGKGLDNSRNFPLIQVL